jgi:hypothetical protein
MLPSTLVSVGGRKPRARTRHFPVRSDVETQQRHGFAGATHALPLPSLSTIKSSIRNRTLHPVHQMSITLKLYRQLKIAFFCYVGVLAAGLLVAVLLASYLPELSQAIWVGSFALSVVGLIWYAYIYWRLCRYLDSSTLWLLICCCLLGPFGVILTFFEMRSLVAKEPSETPR